ncbi:MAG: Txe/YoeB family addiction module toxin [Pyramidobacter sp.]|nr:Txe/YoeB family addiction module toxin [Pyramidobacter sp.]
MSEIKFSEIGCKEYLYWQSQNRKIVDKINKLLKSIERDGANAGEGQPELLKYGDGEKYSRRINEKDRLVYRVEDGVITVETCRGHYDDK